MRQEEMQEMLESHAAGLAVVKEMGFNQLSVVNTETNKGGNDTDNENSDESEENLENGEKILAGLNNVPIYDMHDDNLNFDNKEDAHNIHNDKIDEVEKIEANNDNLHKEENEEEGGYNLEAHINQDHNYGKASNHSSFNLGHEVNARNEYEDEHHKHDYKESNENVTTQDDKVNFYADDGHAHLAGTENRLYSDHKPIDFDEDNAIGTIDHNVIEYNVHHNEGDHEVYRSMANDYLNESIVHATNAIEDDEKIELGDLA